MGSERGSAAPRGPEEQVGTLSPPGPASPWAGRAQEVSELNQPSPTAPTLHARVDAARCTGCGTCVEECPQGAIALLRHVAQVEAVRCTGCGKCVEVCPEDAIALV